jgi:hypothetical protein
VVHKLDFAKAFDTVEHNATLAMHKQLGFPDKWVQWVDSTLRSGSLAVLLNGVPRKNTLMKKRDSTRRSIIPLCSL